MKARSYGSDTRCRRIPPATMLLCFFTCSAVAQDPINLLCLKGTHNSYASSHRCDCVCVPSYCYCWAVNKCPVMHHHPQLQVDDFGVWALELDFSIKAKDGVPRAIVGHDGECGEGCWTHEAWGPYLDDYLVRLRETRSFAYRPLILFFEKKCCWGDDSYDPADRWMPFLERILQDVFADAALFRYDAWVAGGRAWPSAPTLAGAVISVAFPGGCGNPEEPCPPGFGGTGILFPVSEALSRWGLESPGCASAEQIASASGSGADIIAIDQYQYDYTFEYVAPPNPLVVDQSSPGAWLVRNDEPDGPWFSDEPCWIGEDCEADDWCTRREFTVHEQGTFRFPYRTVGAAVNRAAAGWTVLIKPGVYPEAITIHKPLTLEADSGTVTIGQ